MLELLVLGFQGIPSPPNSRQLGFRAPHNGIFFLPLCSFPPDMAQTGSRQGTGHREGGRQGTEHKEGSRQGTEHREGAGRG